MDKLSLIESKAFQEIQDTENLNQLNEVRVLYLGKKGPLQDVMKELKDLSIEEKKQLGKRVNDLKFALENAIEERRQVLEVKELNEKLEKEKIDLSLNANYFNQGGLHPLMKVQQELEDIFISMGYDVAKISEVELDLYNFERANIPFDHPARDMQDTFYIDVERLLRTHTTAVQMRYLEENAQNLPIQVVCPGKVYRRDDDDATHSHQFMQIEGLVVGENIKMSDLKGTLLLMAQKMFGPSQQIRFRPSYFQFTEPSVEVDVSCPFCNGKGCSVCKKTGWIEILGAGMVHPKVLEMAGIDSEKYSGFAFGAGIDRIAMLKYGVDDIRHFFTNDIRFLKTFGRFE